MQVLPFPAPQGLWRRLELTGRVGHVVVLERRAGGGQGGPIGLVQGRLFLGVRLLRWAFARSRCSFASSHFQVTPPIPPNRETVRRASNSATNGRRRHARASRAAAPTGRAMHVLALPEAPQVFGQRQGAGVATAGLFLQAVQRDRLQVARQAGLQAARPGRLVGSHGPQQLQGAVAPGTAVAP